ncbi:MAG: FAD-dependent oxidoreductase [Sphingomonadales bacterium]
MTAETLDCDFLVIGAGMAGLSAAARAAEAGARVVVVEKAADIGGSSALSGGVVWTLPSTRKLRYVDDGDPALGEVIVGSFADGIGWMRRRGVDVSEAVPVLYGRGYRTDIIGHLRACVSTVTAAGGHVVTLTDTAALLTDPAGRVTGARTRHADGAADIRAPWTLLATGGFQADADWRARYIHANARDIRLRSNPVSTGGGIRLGLAAGGAFTDDNPGFYGHLVADTPAWGDPRLFTTLTQYHSEHGVLLNQAGRRFADESIADHVSTQAVVAEPGARALLVWDERIHRDHAVTPVVKGTSSLDRFDVAMAHGAAGIGAATLEEIAGFAANHGFDGPSSLATLRSFNDLARAAPETLSPPRVDYAVPLESAPYYALVVRPAITFTHAGLRADASARVLAGNGRPVDGLLVAGADVGNAYRIGYGGGLALALTFGLRAAQTAGFGT